MEAIPSKKDKNIAAVQQRNGRCKEHGLEFELCCMECGGEDEPMCSICFCEHICIHHSSKAAHLSAIVHNKLETFNVGSEYLLDQEQIISDHRKKAESIVKRGDAARVALKDGLTTLQKALEAQIKLESKTDADMLSVQERTLKAIVEYESKLAASQKSPKMAKEEATELYNKSKYWEAFTKLRDVERKGIGSKQELEAIEKGLSEGEKILSKYEKGIAAVKSMAGLTIEKYDQAIRDNVSQESINIH